MVDSNCVFRYRVPKDLGAAGADDVVAIVVMVVVVVGSVVVRKIVFRWVVLTTETTGVSLPPSP